MRPTKRCARCGEYKSIDDFRQYSKAAWCILCERAYQKEYKATARGREINKAAKRKYKRNDKTQVMQQPVGKKSSCEKCDSYVVCHSQINRPTFWPACWVCSKFYDPALASKVNRSPKAEAV
jgi:hypothetical protein